MSLDIGTLPASITVENGAYEVLRVYRDPPVTGRIITELVAPGAGGGVRVVTDGTIRATEFSGGVLIMLPEEVHGGQSNPGDIILPATNAADPDGSPQWASIRVALTGDRQGTNVSVLRVDKNNVLNLSAQFPQLELQPYQQNGAAVVLGVMGGGLFVVSDEATKYACAYLISGTSIVEIADPSGFYGTTRDGVTPLVVYWDSSVNGGSWICHNQSNQIRQVAFTAFGMT